MEYCWYEMWSSIDSNFIYKSETDLKIDLKFRHSGLSRWLTDKYNMTDVIQGNWKLRCSIREYAELGREQMGGYESCLGINILVRGEE